MERIHLAKDGKFAPQCPEEYEAIIYLLTGELFYFEYLHPSTRKYLNLMTEEEKNFVKSKKKYLTDTPICDIIKPSKGRKTQNQKGKIL